MTLHISAFPPSAILDSILFTLRSEVLTINYMVILLILNQKPRGLKIERFSDSFGANSNLI